MRSALAVAALLLAVSRPCYAQVAAGEYEIKAAFLPNFARFVGWPSSVLPAGAPFVIGIVGDDPFGSLLTHAVAGQFVEGHPLQMRYVRWNEGFRGCHILFIASSEVPHITQILSEAAIAGALTVADFESFARRGGMIELRMVGNRVRFDINSGAAAASGLRISSRLLILALHVYTNGEERS